MFKLIDKKIIAILRSKILLNWPYASIVLLRDVFEKKKFKSAEDKKACKISQHAKSKTVFNHLISSLVSLGFWNDFWLCTVDR